MKNAHGVEPTRYMKRKESEHAIQCYPGDGPIFGDDIYIGNNCSKEDSCSIWNNGKGSYECHPKYNSLLFVNTAGPNEENKFSVLDYEVYTSYDSYKDYVFNSCKHPDIIWEYIETKDISEESLKQFDDDTKLLKDLDVIHCVDSFIRFKISNYCLKNPSEFLPDTQIVSQQYDDKLREWLGNDYKWRLIYRASEHGYTAKSFHDYCDNKGPTLIVIKSSGGWIFGGYTTRSWKRVHPEDDDGGIYNDMI